jgi:hypothetical protein
MAPGVLHTLIRLGMIASDPLGSRRLRLRLRRASLRFQPKVA